METEALPTPALPGKNDIGAEGRSMPLRGVAFVIMAALCFLTTILTSTDSSALEIYKNSKRFDIFAQLPKGYQFQVDKIDRKFQIGNISGNLRLIQDNSYESCSQLVDERRDNWVKYGYTQSADRYVSRNECSIRITNPAERRSSNSFYISSDACDCFIALQFSYNEDDRANYERFAPQIVSSVRRNNSGPAGPSIVAANAPSASKTEAKNATPQPVQIDASVKLPPELQNLLTKISALGCVGKGDGEDLKSAILLLSAWKGQRLDEFARDAGFPNLAASMAANGGVLAPDRQMLAQFARSQASAVASIDRYVQRHGTALCPIFFTVFASDMTWMAEQQQSLRSTFHGYIFMVQQLAGLHGCFLNTPDGAFGPASRTAWNRLLLGRGLPALRDDRVPTLPDLIDLAAAPASSGACDQPDSGGLAAAALPFLTSSFGGQTDWVVRATPAIVATLNDFAQANRWTPWSSRLALSISGQRDGAANGTKERMLSQIYEQGIGVKPAPAAALYWKNRSRREATTYSHYLEGLDDPDKAIAAVRFIMNDRIKRMGEAMPPSSMMAGPIRIDGAAGVSVGDIADLFRLCTLVTRHRVAFDRLKSDATPAFLFIVADRLLAGASLDGKAPELAAELLEAAARKNSDYASSRLAFLYAHGLGVTQDRQRAYEFAQSASKSREPFALLQLARMTEEDRPENVGAILTFYRQLLEEAKRSESMARFPVEMITNRIMTGGPAFGSPAGKALIDEAGKAPEFARSLADLYLCTQCGGVVDLAEGARWLRRWYRSAENQQGSAFFLYRFLTANPALKSSPDETDQILKASIKVPKDGSGTVLGFESDIGSFLALRIADMRRGNVKADISRPLTMLLDKLCSGETGEVYCEKAEKLLASGMFGLDLVAIGIDRLKRSNSRELIDVLAAYGDFSGALSLAQKAEGKDISSTDPVLQQRSEISSDLLQDVTSLRSATFRRLIARRDMADLASLPTDFAPFLRFLAARGDEEARGYVSILGVGKTEAPIINRDAKATQAAFDRIKARSGIGRAFVNAARENALALQASGERRTALQMELTAVAAEIQLDRITTVGSGPLQGALTNACHLSRASESAFTLGANGLAMVFAKDAINVLQGVRGQLAVIPENLQGCFRDLISDNYRWLADLLVRQDRLGEAQFVLGLLKDFEAFQFVDRDRDFAGAAFQTIPYSPAEERLKAAITGMRLPVISNAWRANELRDQTRIRSLSAAETRELADIEGQLRRAGENYQQDLAKILEAAETVDQADNVSVLANLGSAGTLVDGDSDGRTAAIHYLVLPDRLNIILTTRTGRKRYVVTEWEGRPFSESRLNAEITKLHDVLSDYTRNPLPQSQKLHQLLIKPIAGDLAASGAKQLLLSLDRRLRYIPFNALHDGDRFLVENFDTSLLTNSGFEISGQAAWGIPLSALGTTQAAGDFEALPGVAIELSGIVKGADGGGILNGNVKLDKDFSKRALETALKGTTAKSDDVGIVHIASHFMLGDKDANSFLLLGTGEHLTLKEIKEQKAIYNFARVDLLTLSACSTGFANPEADGRDIDSLAKITSDRGARSTLASLWPVADSSTALLMQRFYELREIGRMSKIRAISEVQREFIHRNLGSTAELNGKSVVLATAPRAGIEVKQGASGGLDLPFSHPYFWAPFILTGNWR